jgi:hypothetical protein
LSEAAVVPRILSGVYRFRAWFLRAWG